MAHYAASTAGEPPQPLALLDLPHACWLSVFTRLGAADLAAVQLTCAALRDAAASNTPWLGLVARDFGLSVASSARAAPTAGRALYRQLRAGAAFCRAIPTRAVATDGGCDAPDYWADNMFVPNHTALYCSQAAARNVHVFARFVRDAALDDSAPTTPSQQQHQQQQQAYLIERCLWPAMELIAPAAQAAALQAAATAMSSLEQYSPPQQEGLCDGPAPSAAAAGANTSSSSSSRCSAAAAAQQGAAGGECSGGGSLSSLRRLYSSPPFAGLRLNASQQKQLATTAVLNACSTTGLVELFMSTFVAFEAQALWARGFLKGLTHQTQVQALHNVMFQLSFEDQSGQRSKELVNMQPQQQQQQQQRRTLLCDQQQLAALASVGCCSNTCLIHELVLDRADQATAPLQSGMLFFGCVVTQQLAAAAGGGSSSRPAALADASAAKSAAAALGRLAQQPWVAASNDLTSAAAVFAAAAAGLLPPVLRYQRAQAGVFIEFQPPTLEQLQEQAQHAAAGATGSGALAGIVLAPALWFRFSDAGAAAQPGEQDAAAEAQGAGDVQGLLQHPFFGDADEDAASDGDAGSSSSDGAAASEDPAAGLAAGAGEAGAGPAAEGGAGPAVAHMPEPEPVPPAPVCEAEPQMPAGAVEVGTALGWHPTAQRPGLLAVRLARPRLASLVCAKLLDSEDRNAEFNAKRGGCNVDCELVMCRGQDLWEVPDGLTVLGPCG